MRMNALASGLLLAAGVLACGGTDTTDVQAPVEEAVSQEQSLQPSCPSGYTSVYSWECRRLQAGEPPCRYGTIGHYNALHLFCESENDWYDAGPTGNYVCGDCY